MHRSLQSGSVMPSDIELPSFSDLSGTVTKDSADTDTAAPPSGCFAVLDARWTAAEAWWAKRKQEKRVQVLLRIVSVLYFLAKMCWAAYVSYVVQGYYQQFQELQVQMTTAQAQVMSTRAEVGGLGGNLAALAVSVNATGAQLTYLNGTIDVLALSVDGAQAQIFAAQGQIEGTQRDLNGLSDQLTSVTTSASATAGQVAALNGTVGALSSSVDATQTQIARVGRDVGIVAADVAGAQDNLHRLNASLVVLNSTLEVVYVQLARMNATTSAVDDAVKDVATATSTVAAIKDQLDGMSSRMSQYNESSTRLATDLTSRMDATSVDAQRRMDGLNTLINQQSATIQVKFNQSLEAMGARMAQYNESAMRLAAEWSSRLNTTAVDAQRQMSGLNTLISQQSQVLQADINSSHVALEGVSTRLSALLRNVSLTELPVGSIVSLASAYVPPGFLLCNGSSVSKAAYPLLFSAIGDTYGASPPAGSFFLPDLRGRVAAGLDAMGSNVPAGRINSITDGLGAVAGQEAEVLTMLHIPAHNHGSGTLSINGGSHTHTDQGHTHPFVGRSASGGNADPVMQSAGATFVTKMTALGYANLSLSTHQHLSSEFSGLTASAGQSAPSPLSKLQPTMLLNFIIKATSLA